MDDFVKRDREIRQRIQSIYNREREDFESARDYDDYLEEREDIIFNLVQGTEVRETEEKVKSYQKEHAEEIAKNEARKLQRVLAAEEEMQDAKVLVDEAAAVEDAVLVHHDDSIATDTAVVLPSQKEVGHALSKQTKKEWMAMALSSGWRDDMQRSKCVDLARRSLLNF
ncbi:hypothetical protein M9435_003590 [Picochlorum sp. BPE23]|nr:hypothetical protein M9435_003590 [Picochlorum sp. BPE23]